MDFIKKPMATPLTQLHSPLFTQYQVKVWMKRDDLNHPVVQGNKWHKLKYNLIQAKLTHKNTILTFGGAYSNHIAATAAAAKDADLQSIGVIRGNELENSPEKWSPTLQVAAENGMQFIFIDRQTYRLKATSDFLTNLQKQYPTSFIIPEGGSNKYAVLGFEDLVTDLYQQCPEWTHIFSPVGTGGTLAGLIHFSNIHQLNTKNTSCRTIVGIPVLKNGDYLSNQIQELLSQATDKLQVDNIQTVAWKLLTQYHDGGYAKQSNKGRNSQHEFEKEFSILLDPIYTSKMIYAFYDQLKTGKIPKGSSIILLHTGGLQGRKNLNKQD